MSALTASCRHVSTHSILSARRQSQHLVGWNSVVLVAVRSLNPLELITRPIGFTYSAISSRIILEPTARGFHKFAFHPTSWLIYFGLRFPSDNNFHTNNNFFQNVTVLLDLSDRQLSIFGKTFAIISQHFPDIGLSFHQLKQNDYSSAILHAHPKQ